MDHTFPERSDWDPSAADHPSANPALPLDIADFSLAPYLDLARRAESLPMTGRVVRTVGLLVESAGPRAQVDRGPSVPACRTMSTSSCFVAAS